MKIILLSTAVSCMCVMHAEELSMREECQPTETVQPAPLIAEVAVEQTMEQEIPIVIQDIPLIAEAPPQVVAKPQSRYNKVRPILEGKVGYFFFSDSKMRKIFDQGGWDFQISASYPIWRWLQIYGSVEYLEKHGKSLHGHQKTSIWEVPLSLGLKPVIAFSAIAHYYVTAGPRYFFFHQHNSSRYVDKNISHNGLGWFVNTGFNFFPWRDAFVIDVFGEYSYKRFHQHTSKDAVYARTKQVGGFCFGIGLGYAF